MYAGRSKSSKNAVALILIMLAAIVVGSFISGMLTNIAKDVPSISGFAKFLDYGPNFGIDPPFSLDLIALTIQIGFTIKFSICSVLFMILGVFIYRKM